jgi:drug/metabolite transporter (DMT)-like permease
MQWTPPDRHRFQFSQTTHRGLCRSSATGIDLYRKAARFTFALMPSSRAAVLATDPVVEPPEQPGSAPPSSSPSPSILPTTRASLPLVIAALAAVYVIWGSTYLVMRMAMEGFPPLFMSGTRFIAAGAALMAILAARGAALPDWRQWRAAALIGVLLFVGGNGFLALAEVHIGSGVAAVVVATMALWMALFAVVGGERPRLGEWIGMGLGFGAVALLSTGGDLRADLGATLLLLVAPISWAAGSILSRRMPKQPAGLLGMAAAQMLVGGVGALALGVATGERMTELPGPGPLMAMAYLILFGSLLTFSAYTWLLRHVRPVLATSYAFVNPLLAVALGAALGGESIGWSTIIAAPAVAVAVALSITARGR